MDPKNVVSPRSRWDLARVLYDEGDGSYAVALGYWDDEPAVGMRWNGNSRDIGFPLSSSYPTWFILPLDLKDAILETLPLSEADRRFARLFMRGVELARAAE
jgi:hypothetical protein